MDDDDHDPWRMTEWDALPNICFIEGCTNEDIDQRGPIWLRDGSLHKACVLHWEAIFRILGEQDRATQERLHDAMHWTPELP